MTLTTGDCDYLLKPRPDRAEGFRNAQKPMDGHTEISVFHAAQRCSNIEDSGLSVKIVSIAAREAIRAGAVRLNFVWSAISIVLRDWRRIVWLTPTSRRSKSRMSPSLSIAEHPKTPISNLNCRMVVVVNSPISPPSDSLNDPPVTMTSQSGLPVRMFATFMLFVMTGMVTTKAW